QNFVAYPCVLGHELAVQVLEVGRGVTGVAAGELCAVLPYLSCGTCPACRRGRGNCCERIEGLGVTTAGGLRERMVLPAAQLFPGRRLTVDQLVLVETLGIGWDAPGRGRAESTADVLVLVETLGIGWHAVARGRPESSDSVLVLGAGPVGLAVALAAQPRVERLL